jgi:hypothetical protein
MTFSAGTRVITVGGNSNAHPEKTVRGGGSPERLMRLRVESAVCVGMSIAELSKTYDSKLFTSAEASCAILLCSFDGAGIQLTPLKAFVYAHLWSEGLCLDDCTWEWASQGQCRADSICFSWHFNRPQTCLRSAQCSYTRQRMCRLSLNLSSASSKHIIFSGWIVYRCVLMWWLSSVTACYSSGTCSSLRCSSSNSAPRGHAS